MVRLSTTKADEEMDGKPLLVEADVAGGRNSAGVGGAPYLLILVLFAVAGLYAVALMVKTGLAFDPFVDGLLALLAVWVPAGVGWIAVRRAGLRRLDVVLASAALSCWAVGDTYLVFQTGVRNDVSPPSLADIGFFGFYAFIIASLVVIIRSRLRDMAWSVILDNAVAAIGASAVLAVALGPILNSALAGADPLAAAMGLAYPLQDLLILAGVVGIGAAGRQGLGPGWVLFVLGLLIFTGADIQSAILASQSSHARGTPLDAVWPVGLALFGSWIVLQGRCQQPSSRSVRTAPAGAVACAATVAGLSVLVFGTQTRVPVPAIVLATLALALAVLPLVFRQRIRLADVGHQARTDELTGLPNRRALYIDVPLRLAANGRRGSAILLLDLDKFKEINDGLGHEAGDDLLRQIAARLAGNLRPTDLLARIGGDEFVIHLDNIGAEESEVVARKLRMVLSDPYDLGGVTAHTNASIGISHAPEQGQDFTVLLRQADMAMYAAKTNHTGCVVYSGGDASPNPSRFHTLEALNAALSTDQLVLHFQPQFHFASGEIRGVEALVRWDHPALGLLPPDAFLSRFEESGLMPALTNIVLEKALDQAAVWSDQGRALTVAVNLSASSIMDWELPERIHALASERRLTPSILVLEITEDLLMADVERASSILSRLRSMGARIAVDDFGKGYSSLSYLRELPIDEIKLDKSFVLSMNEDARAMTVVASTIALAHSLGLEITAEGVEDKAAYEVLGRHQCDRAQGFFMSKPVSADELDNWFLKRPQLSKALQD